MEAGGRCAGRLRGTRARRELPVGFPVGVGLEHDGGAHEDEGADFDPSLQQGQQRRPHHHPSHIEHLGALGAGGVGEVDLARGNAGRGIHRELDRAVDHQFAPGGLADGLDHGRLEDLHVDQIGRGAPGKHRHADDGGRPDHPFSNTHGHSLYQRTKAPRVHRNHCLLARNLPLSRGDPEPGIAAILPAE